LENLDKLLAQIEQAGLRLNKSKCIYMGPRVEYLSYVIDEDDLHPTMAKVEAIRKACTRTCITEFRAFLGVFMCSVYLLSLAQIFLPATCHTMFCCHYRVEDFFETVIVLGVLAMLAR